MRIALFSGNYNYIREGANQALNMLVRYLETRGHHVRVYSPVTDTPAFEPAGTLVPVPSVAFPVRNEFRLALGLPRTVRRDIADFVPDIVHVATPDILDARAQTLARQLGIPIVASMHTRFETYLDHYHLGFLRPVVEALLRRFYRRSDHVLAPTPSLVEEMMRLRGDGQVSLWSRGVDRARFDPARRDMNWRRAQGWADEDIVLLFFGRLVLEKGVEEYAAAVRILEQRGVRVHPLIVGAGPASAPLEALPGAVLTGHLQDDALARAIASADILLNPSRTEAFGNVVLEAMAAGLAIVSADAPSAAALIEHGETGLLCPLADPALYADAIQDLIADGGRRRKMGAAARTASGAYRWDDASASVERAYQKLLDRKAAMRHH